MLYRAKVIDNRPNDPLWKLLVQVPALYGESQVEALPMLIANTLQERPAIGSGVWVMESDGDSAVWMGQFATAGMDVDALLDSGHDQYLTNAKHDITARHTFGAALGTPSAPPDIATAGAAGSGASPSRSDHTHKVGTGAINNSAMFAAGVVNTAALAALGSAAGPIGDASHVAVVTKDVTGRVSALTSTAIAIANTAVSGLGTLSTQNGTFSGTHSGSSSGTNTGDQTISITLTGDVIGGPVSGTGAINISTTLAGGTGLGIPIQGSTQLTTDGAGDITISYGHTFNNPPKPVVCIGDVLPNQMVAVHDGNNTTTGTKVRIYNPSTGAAVTGTPTRVNWIVREP